MSTENQKVVHEIAGKKYVLVEIPIIEGKYEAAKAFIKRNGLIHHGVKTIDRGGFFGKAVVVETFFLPEENFEKYSKDDI